MFGGAGVGLLGHSEVGDLGVVSGLMPSSSVDNSYTTGVEVKGKGTGGCYLVSMPHWFLACDRVWMPRVVLAEAGGTLVSVVTSSKFKLHWGVRLGVSVVIFCFLSWEVAISFALSFGCGQERLSGRDVCVPGVGSTAGSWVSGGFVVSGPSSVVLLGPASSTIRTGDLRSMR